MIHKINRIIPLSKLICMICFVLCFFVFMMIEAFINERCAVILGSSFVNIIYTLGLICTGIGFLSFSLLYKICKSKKLKKTVLLIINILCLTSDIILITADSSVIFIFCSFMALLFIGHICGFVYYNTAMCFFESRYIGRMLGIGMGSAIFLQFIVQNLTKQPVIPIISIFISTVFMIYFILRVSDDLTFENYNSFSDIRKNHKTAVVLIVSIILMSIVSGMIDSVLTAFNAEKSYNIYSGVRLFYALGLILAGFIADIKRRKYLPLSMVCAILLSSICMFFLSDKVSYFAATSLMYLYSGFYVIFLTVMFLDFAPKSRCPHLWAGMGRIVRSFTVAAVILPSLRIYDALGSRILAVASCLLSICILLVLLPYIGSAVSGSKEHSRESSKEEVSSKERLNLYAKHCSLTPRETEVLEMLLTTDEDLQGIAGNLYISRRMVQRYVSSIYEKTKTKTRLGLFKSYMNFTTD